MTSPTIDIEALKAAAEKATPGPWFNVVVERPMRIGDSYDSNGWTMEFVGYEILGQDDAVVHSATDGFQREEDAEFSARFDPPTALSLIARTEAAEGEVERLKVENVNLRIAFDMASESREAFFRQLKAAEAQSDRLVEALERIRDLEQAPFEYPADMWEQIAACEDCQRYKDHPIQRGICDTHRRPFWAREKHDDHEERRLGWSAKGIAREALSATTPEQSA